MRTSYLYNGIIYTCKTLLYQMVPPKTLYNEWGCVFSVNPFPCDDRQNIYTLSYYHHQIGSMIYYPLFRVKSWNNGVPCMSFCILMTVWYNELHMVATVNSEMAIPVKFSGRERFGNHGVCSRILIMGKKFSNDWNVVFSCLKYINTYKYYMWVSFCCPMTGTRVFVDRQLIQNRIIYWYFQKDFVDTDLLRTGEKSTIE